LNPNYPNFVASSSGRFSWVNTDETTWTTAYQVGGTSLDVTPTDSSGNVHSQLIGEMGGIGFSNGAATAPEKTYSWSGTSNSGQRINYVMEMYPLTWTLNFATSTRNFQHIFYYIDNVVNMQISLNQDMWYFSNAPSNVYFGIADIELTNFTVIYSAGASSFLKDNVRTAIIPSAQYALLSITSPTNGETAADAFYSYEGAELNPEMFAPSVTTSVTISDLAPSAAYDLLSGVWTGEDASVHLVFQVDTFVVGAWTVTPTFHGTGGTITPQGTKAPTNILASLFNGLENALVNNPLADLVILIVIVGIVLVVLVVLFPEFTKSLSHAVSTTINNHTKNSGKTKSRNRSKSKNG
jgi:hypothetical protein